MEEDSPFSEVQETRSFFKRKMERCVKTRWRTEVTGPSGDSEEVRSLHWK